MHTRMYIGVFAYLGYPGLTALLMHGELKGNDNLEKRDLQISLCVLHMYYCIRILTLIYGINNMDQCIANR